MVMPGATVDSHLCRQVVRLVQLDIIATAVVAAMEPVGISFPSDKKTQGPTLDLNRLVQWALAHGYQHDCLTLTLAWHRGEIEESLGRKIGDEDWRRAQQWLDETSGGFAAYNVYHALEEIQTELVGRLESGLPL